MSSPINTGPPSARMIFFICNPFPPDRCPQILSYRHSTNGQTTTYPIKARQLQSMANYVCLLQSWNRIYGTITSSSWRSKHNRTVCRAAHSHSVHIWAKWQKRTSNDSEVNMEYQ